jgi:hypothetical protein
MTSHKRKAQTDGKDNVAAEAQQRAQSAAARAPSDVRAVLNPPATPAAASAASVSFSLRSSEDMLPRALPAAVVADLPFPSPVASSSAAAAVLREATPAAVIAADSFAANLIAQASPAALSSFDRLADVEVQLIMQQLDASSILRLARCSRSLFRCTSHPFGWQRLWFPVDVRGSDVIEDPRRASPLLRFVSSTASVERHESDSNSLVSCATLLRVPRLIALSFQRSPYPIMRLGEWHAFLRHPSTQRVVRVNLWRQPALCDTVSISLLSELPLLDMLGLHLPSAASASHLAPLVNFLSLTSIHLFGPLPLDGGATVLVPLEPLARCARLRSLSLFCLLLRAGQLRERSCNWYVRVDGCTRCIWHTCACFQGTTLWSIPRLCPRGMR